MCLLQEEGGYTSSLYFYEDSEGYEPLAKIEGDLRSHPSIDANAAEVAQYPATGTEADRPPQHITAANDQYYEDGWPISLQHTPYSFTISSIAGSAPGAGAMRLFDAKSLLQTAQNAPGYF